MKKITFLLILVLLIASILRIFMLGQIPVSMTDDEIRLTYSSYSIWHTAKDISGNLLPLTFVIDQYAFNPVAIYLTSPFVGVLGLSMFSARLSFAVAGILTVFLVYLVANKLFSNRFTAILSAFVLTISAWHLQLSRTAYEGQFALLFYLLGIYVFLLTKKHKFLHLILSLLIFAMAFYSYSGTKLILIPVIFALVFYKYKDLGKKQIVIVLLGIFLVFFSFFLLSKFQNASSYGSIQFFFQDKRIVANAVELERRASHEPGPIKWFYYNKLTYLSKIFINHYSYAFSPQYFFTTQEGNGIFSMWNRGQLYLIEAPLLLLGVFYLFQKKRREFWLLIFFLIIAPLPSGLGADPITYTVRSSFMLPWLMIFVGSGIYAISYFCKNLKLTILLYLLLSIIYIYSVGGYLTQYYFDWMVYGSKYYSKGTQDLVYLIGKEKTKFNQVMIVGATNNTFLHYAFYNKLDPRFVQKALKQTPIKVENTTFINSCPNNGMGNPKDLVTKSTLFIAPIVCYQSVKPDYIMTADDGSEKYWDVYQIHD